MDHDSTYHVINIRPAQANPTQAEPTPGDPVFQPAKRTFWGSMILFDLTVIICLLHGWGIWLAVEGREGLNNGWPITKNDHTLYYHSAQITRTFLQQTGTTAGYDPFFMAGYAKSFIFPSSSTLPEVVVALFGQKNPEYAYKLYVLFASASIPWWIFLATRWIGGNITACLAAVGLTMIYFWSGFSVGYLYYGMVPYALGIPLGLVSIAAISGYVQEGGFSRWFLAAFFASLCVLVHFTTAMVVVPAAAAIYFLGVIRASHAKSQFGVMRHLGVWLIPIVVILANAFWWYPGYVLMDTVGGSAPFFNHPESVLKRVLEILFVNIPIEVSCLAGGMFGLAFLMRRKPIAATGLMVFILSGFSWGYMAGSSRLLDFLQPGRHTYAFFLGLGVAAGLGWEELCRRLSVARGGASRWVALVILLVCLRILGEPLDLAFVNNLQLKKSLLQQATSVLGLQFDWATKYFPRPYIILASQPTTRQLWLFDRVKAHVAPGERLLYEESGIEIKGEPDPFQGGRFSGLLPERCGVEVIGGPYLHASLKTNFTQFGEGKMFENPAWDRDSFVRFAKIYRPSAILCWSKKARAFCEENPDLIEIKEREPKGSLILARVKGFGGSTIRGQATVKAEANKLTISDIKPDLDGLVVLRYHSVPCLRSLPEGRWEPVLIDGDPVPFIGVKASTEPIVIEMAIPLPWQQK
jgi:hypothetical protein